MGFKIVYISIYTIYIIYFFLFFLVENHKNKRLQNISLYAILSTSSEKEPQYQKMETKTFLDAGVTTSQTQAKITLTIKDGEPNIDFKTLSHCTTEALVNLLCNALLVTLNHAMQNSEKQIALQNLTNEQAEAAKDEAEEYFFDMANNCFSAVLNKFSPDIFNEPIPIEEARKLLEKEDAVLAKLVSAEEADGWQTK